jgi:hypothetical protein
MIEVAVSSSFKDLSSFLLMRFHYWFYLMNYYWCFTFMAVQRFPFFESFLSFLNLMCLEKFYLKAPQKLIL